MVLFEGALCLVLCTLYFVLGALYFDAYTLIISVEFKVPSTKYQVPSTKYKAQSVQNSLYCNSATSCWNSKSLRSESKASSVLAQCATVLNPFSKARRSEMSAGPFSPSRAYAQEQE